MTQLEKELQDVSNVAIAGHIHPDGDSVGSCIGLWQYLRDNYPQIKADIWLEQPDNKFSIIEGYEELKQPDGQDRTYDLFISVDCAALDRLGDALPYFQKAKRTFCVDHAMEDQTIIVAFLYQTDEVVDCVRSNLRIQLCFDDAAIFHFKCNNRILCHIFYLLFSMPFGTEHY